MRQRPPGGPPRRAFARQLFRLSDLVRVAETRRSFRSKAFSRAVWSLDEVPPSLEIDRDELLQVPGIGPGVASLIEEFRDTGGIAEVSHLEEDLPQEAGRLRRLPRMNQRIMRELKAKGVETRNDLVVAIESDLMGDSITGIGPATIELWRKILDLPPSSSAVPAHEAWVIGRSLAAHVAVHTRVWVDVAGAVRRVEEWVDELNLVVTTNDREHVADFLENTAVLAESRPGGPHVAGTTLSGLPVSIALAVPEEAGTALVLATGPPEHVATVEGEHPQPTEHDVYRAAGFPWISPPARGLPIDSASQVVQREELRGDLHLHSLSSPDGRMSLDEIAVDARKRGYDYVLITDHTIGLRFGGLDAGGLFRQAEEIAATRVRHPEIEILHGAELNIDREGGLDIDEEGQALLDFAVAGLHSHFGLSREEQTERLVRAVSHPVVKVLAHPFGRRIGIRPGIEVDFEQVIEAAVERGVALESNGHRDRLDLPATWIEFGAGRGAVFAANSDAHRLAELDNVVSALASLQRAGIGSDRVVNCWPIDELRSWADADAKLGN